MAQMVEYLLNKCKALSSNPILEKKNKKPKMINTFTLDDIEMAVQGQ
jgi:hypothetical protein